MGLFSNNKKPCPICGNATPRLLPTKVEGVPICKECDKKIDLPNGVLDSMTLDDFRRYIDFYNKNQVLRERFHPEYRFGFGKKEVKEMLAAEKKANLTVRNFPATVAELRKRLKLAEGGGTYLFATTLADEKKVLIRCQATG